jgi:chlorophyll synthase
MLVPQVGAVALLVALGRPIHAAIIVVLVAMQYAAVRILLEDPRRRAVWYSAVGVLFFVAGMMVSALAVR